MDVRSWEEQTVLVKNTEASYISKGTVSMKIQPIPEEKQIPSQKSRKMFSAKTFREAECQSHRRDETTELSSSTLKVFQTKQGPFVWIYLDWAPL